MNKLAKANKSTQSHRGSVSQSSGNTLSQVRNVGTGHYITRDFTSGKFVNIGNKPSEGIKVVKVFKSASNPSISKETAALAEKAVLAVRNNTAQNK